MSQPRHAKRDSNAGPRRDPAPSEQPTADDDRAAGSRRGLHAVPDPLPGPDPQTPYTTGATRPGRPLTWEEMFVCVPGDPDFQPGDELLEEDFHEWRRWDQAIDREPEIE